MDKNIRYFTELYRILLIITREVTIFLRDKMKNDLRWRNHLPVSISDNDTIEDLDLNTLLFILERFAHEWFRENKLKEIKSTSYNIRIIRNELSHLNYKSLVMKLNFLPVYFETQKIFLNRIGSKSYSEIQNFIQDQKIKEIDYKKIELPIYRKNEENADIYTADWLQALIDSEQHRNSLYFNFTDFLDINFGADNLVPAQKYNLIYVGSTKNHIYDRMPMIQQLNFITIKSSEDYINIEIRFDNIIVREIIVKVLNERLNIQLTEQNIIEFDNYRRTGLVLQTSINEELDIYYAKGTGQIDKWIQFRIKNQIKKIYKEKLFKSICEIIDKLPDNNLNKLK